MCTVGAREGEVDILDLELGYSIVLSDAEEAQYTVTDLGPLCPQKIRWHYSVSHIMARHVLRFHFMVVYRSVSCIS